MHLDLKGKEQNKKMQLKNAKKRRDSINKRDVGRLGAMVNDLGIFRKHG